MSIFDVNYFAVLVAAIFHMGLGALWYSPNALGTFWAKEHGFALSSLKPESWNYAAAAVVALITAWVFSAFTHWFSVSTLPQGVCFGFYIWLGFVATSHFSGVIWAKKPWKAYLIDAGYLLVSLVVQGGLLAVWK